MDYFVILGPQPAEISALLRAYRLLPTPPVWSFGLWMSHNSFSHGTGAWWLMDSANAAFD
jgi:alpha-glucosidase (family GH31 glycosyl hydrolase)